MAVDLITREHYAALTKAAVARSSLATLWDRYGAGLYTMGIDTAEDPRPEFWPPNRDVTDFHWVRIGMDLPEVMQWMGDYWLMMGDNEIYRPDHPDLAGAAYIGLAVCPSPLVDARGSISALTTERNALRDALAKFVDPAPPPSEEPAFLRVPRRGNKARVGMMTGPGDVA
jgi:hypothetical protein